MLAYSLFSWYNINAPPKRWSQLNEEQRLCALWLKEPLINPETGHSIDRNGPTYIVWRQRCKDVGMVSRPQATGVMTWRKCQEWKRNPTINPDTGRKINEDGKTYKMIEQQCRVIEEKELTLEGDYYLPDSRGMIPCIIYREGRYVVRRYEGRRVWGSLNKPAKNIKLCYYKDTWDYHNNHYRPVFIDSEPIRPVPKARQKKKTENKEPKHVVDTFLDLFIAKP